MRNLLIWLSLVLFAPFAAQAEEVLDRPNYKDRWYVTLVTSTRNTPANARLTQLLAHDEGLRDLLAHTNTTIWDENSQWLRSSDWGALLSQVKPPIVFLQPPVADDGRSPVVYLAYGDNLPLDGSLDELLTAIANQHAAVTQCPLLRPQPPAPTPAPTPLIPLQPTIQPVTPPVDDEGIPLWLFVLPAIGAAAGAWQAVKEEEEGNA